MKNLGENVLPRAVVDTNVWVSAFLNPNGPPARLLAALDQRQFVFVTSEHLVAELAEVLTRPRIVRRYAAPMVAREAFIQLLYARAVIVHTEGSGRVCRDPKDDVVIETALRGQADVIVTRDDDLKNAVEVLDYLRPAGVTVLSVQRFLDMLDL